jgi:hypothetical protein
MSQEYQQSMGRSGEQMHGGQSSQPMRGTQGRMGTSQVGQQSGSAHLSTHETVGQQFESEMTPELNESLEAFDRTVEIAEWCADKCIESGPQMSECARLCEDLADLASLNEKLIARDSINGPEVAEAFLKVAQQGLPILQQHQQMPHVQETYQAVTQAMDATNKLLNAISGGQQSQTTGIRERIHQQGGQSMGTQQPQGQSFQQPQGQSFQQPQRRSFQGTQSY